MPEEVTIEVVERQEWLEPVESGLQQAVSGALNTAGSGVTNFLHGVWLGHPLHPVLTDVPIGAWTAALVLDAAGETRAADLAVTVGLVGAAGSAVTGLTDWQATDGSARRIGLVHGLLNVTATALFTASMVARKRRDRSAGRTLAAIGYGVAVAAAYFGGHLVYRKQIGVDHAVGTEGPAEWTDAVGLEELEDGVGKRVVVGDARVLLVRRGASVFAIGEVCSHLGGPLAEGKIEGDVVQCPWHGSRFCLRDGSVVDGPATHPQPQLETRVVDGRVQVRAARQG